jgi:hypothetical protein
MLMIFVLKISSNNYSFMKTKILVVFLFFILSCVPSKNKLREIDPLSFQEKHICLSDIADDITYIPLDNSYFISSLMEIELTDSLIYVSSMTKNDGGIYAYNWQGLLINKIDDIQGNGPGECTYIIDFTIDSSKDRIYIVDGMQKQIEVYSKKDKYIKTISLKEKVTGFPSDIAFWNSTLILGYSGSEEYNWAMMDTLGNLVSKKKNALYPYNCNVGLLGGFYKYRDKINFWDPFNDTIFTISHDWEYQAAYLFKRGEQWASPMVNDISRFNSLFKIHKVLETKRYMYILCSYDQKARVGLYDKKNSEKYMASGSGISNTIDGGVDFWNCIAYYKKDNTEYLVMSVYPYELKTHVASDEFKNSTPKFPEKKKELEQLANRLNENDNLVLMLVKLKE